MSEFIDLEAECSDYESDPDYDPDDDENDSIINDGCPYCGFSDCDGCEPDECPYCGEWEDDCVCSPEADSSDDDGEAIIDLTGDEEVGDLDGLDEAIATYPDALTYYQTAPGRYAPVFDVDESTQHFPPEEQ